MTTEYSRRQITKLLGCAAAGLAMPALSMAQARKRQFEGRTVNLLAVQFGHHQHLWNLIPEFEKETGIKVNLEYAPFDQTREKTLLDMSSKTGRLLQLLRDLPEAVEQLLHHRRPGLHAWHVDAR